MSTHPQPEKFEAKTNPGIKALLIPGVVGVVALLIGIGVGEIGSDPAPAAATPAVTQTVTLPPKTVTKEVSNPACIDALDKADTALDTASEGFTLASDAFSAIADMDIDSLTDATDGMTTLSPRLKADMASYRAAAADCRR